MKNLLIIALTTVLLTGCQYLDLDTAETAGDVIVTAEHLNQYYEEKGVAGLLGNVELTDSEQATVDQAVSTLDDVKSNLEYYENNPQELISDLNVLVVEYERVKQQYLNVREIVINHEDEYSNEVLETFQLFDRYAYQLDQEVEDLVEEAKKNEAFQNVMDLANAAMKIAAMM